MWFGLPPGPAPCGFVVDVVVQGVGFGIGFGGEVTYGVKDSVLLLGAVWFLIVLGSTYSLIVVVSATMAALRAEGWALRPPGPGWGILSVSLGATVSA